MTGAQGQPAGLPFVKMSGAGNDFVIVDDRDLSWVGREGALALALCPRGLSVGADGLILVRPSERADARMVYLNADGREAALCGNGGRCLAQYLRRTGQAGSHLTLETGGGRVLAAEVGTEDVRLEIAPVSWPPRELSAEVDEGGQSGGTAGAGELGAGAEPPSARKGSQAKAQRGKNRAKGEEGAAASRPRLDEASRHGGSAGSLPAAGRPTREHRVFPGSFLTVGVPHFVHFLPAADLEKLDVEAWGRALRHHPLFAPEGANANFVARLEETAETLAVRTYERGVETETLACGTGCAAAALAAAREFGLAWPVRCRTRGETVLTIHLEEGDPPPGRVMLEGEARWIYSGLADPAILPA